MKNLFLLLFLIIENLCSAQNLVPNPSFEIYDSLPCNFIDSSLQFKNMLHFWTVPNCTTPDLCSPLIPATCKYGNPHSQESAGIQIPRTGNLMIGMACENGGYNEYLQVPLTSPLIVGNAYYAEVYVSLAAKSDFASNDIAMYFSDTIINDVNFQSSNYVPQILDTNTITDTLNWVLVSGCFTATSASRYLIIGNFISNCAHGSYLGGGWPMSYYFFDDVSVTPIPTCNNGTLNCTVGIDEKEFKKVKLYPNPTSDILTIETADRIETVQIKNLLGVSYYSGKGIAGFSEINVQNFPEGVYLIQFKNNFKTEIYRFIKL